MCVCVSSMCVCVSGWVGDRERGLKVKRQRDHFALRRFAVQLSGGAGDAGLRQERQDVRVGVRGAVRGARAAAVRPGPLPQHGGLQTQHDAVRTRRNVSPAQKTQTHRSAQKQNSSEKVIFAKCLRFNNLNCVVVSDAFRSDKFASASSPTASSTSAVSNLTTEVVSHATLDSNASYVRF